MNAFILVFSHPFFAVTDADGRYRIDNVPPGTYNVVAWNEGRLLRAARRSTVPDGGVDGARLRAPMRRPLVAAQPDLPRQRAAGGAVDRRRDLPRQRARDARGRERRCSARSSRPARSSSSCGRRAHETFTMMARLIADAPKLKAAVDTNDPPTVQDVVDDYQKQLNSNLLLVTNRAGRGARDRRRSPRRAAIVVAQPAVDPRRAAPARESVSLLPQPDGMLQLVTVPIADRPRRTRRSSAR